MNKTIVLTGGGTAGHITPNLAIIPLLTDKGFNVEYIGTKNGMEKDIIQNIPYHTISAGKLRRYFSLRNFIDPFKIFAGFLQARHILKKIKPYALFSKGGFVSVPVVFAAHMLGIRVVLHESDYTPGLANRLCIPRSDKVCVAFEPTLKHIPNGKGVYTGLPIRGELLHGSKIKGLHFCGFKGEKPVLLIMGGSLGATVINDVLDKIMPTLTQKYDVAHIRGKKNLLSGALPDSYKQFGFVGHELGDLYAAADIMLSRAGATAIFEILALNLPSLLIPLSKHYSRGDQILNADHFESEGYCTMLIQEDMNEQTLMEGIENLHKNAKKIKSVMQTENLEDAA
ncbi:MAG: undecaprenyldiphospho-muramoylpentapeptide beta-N-acetylglucosaminyltransferase, partial [Clostridia bacterium]|nr:undecaprenyldiphospho-muramoylpentapeptide beta-N-acetylglucosaminyltransferase [Clostridia bacterium]